MATPIAAIDHLHAPLVGTIVKAIQTVTVDRKDPKSKKNVIESMKNRAKPGTGWPQTLIFPEGTTTNGRLLITFKSGAFIPAVPVQPCVISYPREAGIFDFILPVNPVSYCSLSDQLFSPKLTKLVSLELDLWRFVST